MAHLAKVKRGAAGHMIGHYRREMGSDGEFVGLHSHSDIDPARTCLNYNLSRNDYSHGECMAVLERQGVKVLKRKDVNILCDWCCTLPEGFTGKAEEFFGETFRFIKQRYGLPDWAVQSAYVHMDETTPHMHFSFMPVWEKEGKKKLSAKELVNRKDLQTFHQDYEKHMRRQWPDICILNEATRDGNKSVSELKRQAHMEKQAALEKSIKELEMQETGLKGTVIGLEIQTYMLRDELGTLDRKFERGRKELARVMQCVDERAGEAQQLAYDVEGLAAERENLSGQLSVIRERIESVDAFVSKFERAAGQMKDSAAVRMLMERFEGQVRKPLRDVKGKARDLEEVLARIERKAPVRVPARREIIYRKGKKGYGFYEGGEFLGPEKAYPALKKMFPGAVFKDPHGLVAAISGISRMLEK